ncbi:hypothetical protein AYK86_12830 [Acinetobacter venetianus]|nr:hypothetical protein AYL20_10690 [Acinetobacter venetianus]KXO86763.1 hypothetical protein AYK86_12830 [Acinetobacter venetianus]
MENIHNENFYIVLSINFDYFINKINTKTQKAAIHSFGFTRKMYSPKKKSHQQNFDDDLRIILSRS